MKATKGDVFHRMIPIPNKGNRFLHMAREPPQGVHRMLLGTLPRSTLLAVAAAPTTNTKRSIKRNEAARTSRRAARRRGAPTHDAHVTHAARHHPYLRAKPQPMHMKHGRALKTEAKGRGSASHAIASTPAEPTQLSSNLHQLKLRSCAASVVCRAVAGRRWPSVHTHTRAATHRTHTRAWAGASMAESIAPLGIESKR